MGFVPLRCPSCGAEILLDDSREIGFCQYCGTKIVQDKVIVEHRGSVNLDRSDEVKNLLMRAEEKYLDNDLDAAEDYYNRVLDIDANNSITRERLNFVKCIIDKPNLFVTHVPAKFNEGNSKMQVLIDGKCQAKLKAGECEALRISIGKHTVEPRFAILTRNKPVIVNIKDRHTRVDLDFVSNMFGIAKLV